ncbi:MAG: hypothetical protein IH944_05290 [Armatimonadetes bacterium]|nr:hypothetical protein [Armatimonadota bacterium]
MVISAVSVGVCSGPTGLIIMPIADILGDSEYNFTASFSDYKTPYDSRVYDGARFDFGVLDRFEFGVGRRRDGTTALDAKMLVWEERTEGRFAIAAGMMGWDGGEGTEFLVMRYDHDDYRLHFGGQHDQDDRFLFGIDGRLGAGGTWMLEHATGPDGITWAGFAWQVQDVPGLAISAGIGMPTNDPGSTQYIFGISFGGRM